ncbi:T9SS type A sorting domain-containing protein [candidate division KSB1 bacterium]
MLIKKIFLIFLFLPVSLFAQDKKVFPVLKSSNVSFSVGQNNSDSPLEKASSPNSIKLLAIRVEFQEDDNPLTTGNGKFDYSLDSDAFIDPAPHNRQYFLDHLEALKRYYFRVSGEKLTIDYNLFPSGEENAYLLPQKIEYYSPHTTEDALDMGLAELMRDAVQSADNDASIDFSQYDVLIIFHAGVGADFALEETALDPTPNDLPSVYLDLNHLKQTIGNADPGYQGISAEGGTVFISEAVILPETESKRDVEIGLNGITAHQFGHFLGLPSLFNTKTGRPAIGKWGLMGVGFANMNGLVPAEPCAWSKVYLGWETPTVIRNGINLPVTASQISGGTKIYKVPVSPVEYFLIENRVQDTDGDSLNVERSASGVVLEVDDYDFDIPGSGMLIWHIDERVISRGLDDNSVNSDLYMKGVDLEEADGTQDIGEVFQGLLPGVLSPENGYPWDAYYSGNNSEFTISTVPNSLSNFRGDTHVSVTDISNKGNTMSFSISQDFYSENFPVDLKDDFSGMAPIRTNYTNIDSVNLLVPGRSGKIYALNGLDQLIGNPALDVPVFIDAGADISFQPAFGISLMQNGEGNKLYVATEEPGIKIYSAVDGNGDNMGDPDREWSISSPVSTPVLLNSFVITGNNNGSIDFFMDNIQPAASVQLGSFPVTGLSGSRDIYGVLNITALNTGGRLVISSDNGENFVNLGFDVSGAPLISDLDNDDNLDVTVIGLNGEIDINRKRSDIVNLTGQMDRSPAAGDINGDGFREIVIFSGTRIYALEHNASVLTGFPVDVSSKGYPGDISTEPVLADLTGDGKQNMLFGTADGNVFAINEYGEMIPGFPLVTAGSVTGSITLLKNVTADKMEITALDDQGYLYKWDINTTYNDKVIAWSTLAGDNSNSRTNNETLTAVIQPVSEQLMPADRVYNWPNPCNDVTRIRYYLNYDSEVKIKIFDQIGSMVANLSGPGISGVDNEVEWIVNGIPPGVYYAEVSASGNNIVNKKVIKIAVVH